ncbi:MAG: DNA primase [Clostridium sp.]
MISEDILERIKDENDIADVISETVRLKRVGRNYSGLCPFHSEKTPSFSVSSDKQMFKCFGCGEVGNVITFVMKTKNMNFPEACELLAKRANIEILSKDRGKNEKNEKLYELNVEVARFFFSNLQKKKEVKDYFIRRGITEQTIRRFGLGYSLDSWNSLMKYLKSKGYTELDMLSLGVVAKGDKNTYDRFRNRVMFPVFNQYGKVIGFGGRVLDDSKPKYLNSPETVLFNKGYNLYGLNFAIKNLKKRTFIIVEGYMDCISLHQYGITNVVASLGTALTQGQAKLMKRYVDEVIISYDADLAGKAATIRGLEVLRKEGFEVKVLTVPQGKDPDEFIKSNGKEAFERLVETAVSLIEYRISRAKEGLNLKDNASLIEYIKRITEILIDLDPIEKDVYIKRISEETKIKEEAIYDLFNKELKNRMKNSEEMNTSQEFRQKLYVEPSYVKAERLILRMMLVENMFQDIREKFSEENFIRQESKELYNLIVEFNGYGDNIKKIENRCVDADTIKEWINIIELKILKQDDSEKLVKLIDDCKKQIGNYKIEESRKDIMSKIKEFESKGMLEESIKLAEKLMEIEKQLTK